MTTEVERRLTNILSADVYGYSRLMGLDEAGCGFASASISATSWSSATICSATTSISPPGYRLAEPGGVLISGTVFEQVKNKLTLAFDPLRPQRLKNIGAEVTAYRAVLGGEGTTPAVTSKDAEAKHQAEKRHRFKISAARTAALVGVFGLINLFAWDGELWFQWPALAVLFVFAMRTTFIFRK